MWEIWEHKSIEKIIKKLPAQIVERYEFWKLIIEESGPEGLLHIKGFHDEALKGEWKNFRSSRLNIQYRVIYSVDRHKVKVRVEKITPHEYRRR